MLEILERHEPAVLRGFLTREIFSFANVPYRIKPYAQLLTIRGKPWFSIRTWKSLCADVFGLGRGRQTRLG